MHRVYVANVHRKETMKYYIDEDDSTAFEQMVPGRYYRCNRDYGICEINEHASNKSKILRYLNRTGSLTGTNECLYEVDMTDRMLAILKDRNDREVGFIDEMRTW